MHKIKEQKGITLIALVITIVVMLILVGVTVSVSLNGGLFSTAKEATDETQTAKESEELLMAAMGALGENGEVDLSKLDNSLPQGFQKTETGAYKSTTTGNIFTVATNGKITLEGSSSEEEPETPVTPPATQETEITGTWLFNETITLQPYSDFTLNYKVGDIEYVKMNMGEEDLNYFKLTEGNNLHVTSVYNDYSKWNESEYRTIEILTSKSEMENGEEFLAWLNANAVKQVTQISFTIDGTTYYAEEGMTWKEWCEDSTYCTLTGVTCEVVISYNNYATLIDSNRVTVESSAEIESGAAYSFSHSGGQ